MIILGIESSCDETAAAVVQNRTDILSSIIASQMEVHQKYGGVVPELASRMHIEAITSVVEKAIKEAGISPDQIDGVAVTQGPGLIGALLVGFTFAKAFAYARNLHFVGVNHLEAHIYSLFLMKKRPDFPFIGLVVSGGHTNIYYVDSAESFELMGQTRDDAAGEAFDKVAKMLNLGYPGGPVIERIAKYQDPNAIKFPRSLLEKDSFDFSFSGLKSSVSRYINQNQIATEEDKAIVASCFQAAVIDVLSEKLFMAAKKKKCTRIGVTGGVAANQTFVSIMTEQAADKGIQIFSPHISLCGDNAAMVAARGYIMIEKGQTSSLEEDVFSRNSV